MAAGHRYDFARVEKPRGADQPVLDRAPEAPVSAADIPHRRKAAIERKAQHADRVRCSVRIAREIDLLDADVRCVGVDVRIDQSRHQGAAADIENFRLGRLDRFARNLADCACLDQDVLALRAVLALAVKDARVFQQDGRHTFLTLDEI